MTEHGVLVSLNVISVSFSYKHLRLFPLLLILKNGSSVVIGWNALLLLNTFVLQGLVAEAVASSAGYRVQQ